MNSVSRRKFLKISASTVVASATVTGVSTLSKQVLKADEAQKGIEAIPTYCEICFWKCGAIAYKKDGKLWKIEGNPKDLLSNGRLCPRGSGGVGAYYDPDRLKSPLIRKKERGKEVWQEVTWDEALTYIADKMKTIKQKYGPESMALFSHGVGGNFFKHTLKAYGSKNIAAPSYAQCRGPRDAGFDLTFGDNPGSPERTDIENTKCMALIGSHLGENMHNSQVQEFSRAIENKASFIVVDPRFSVAASKAKYYLPIKPGTDIALLLAWMNVIINEGLYSKDYIEKYTFGFEQLKAHVAKYTPEWAYVETGIEPELIKDSARELAKNAPASFVHPGRHVTWYGDDTQRSRAIAIVNGLLGNWGEKGGFYNQAYMDLPPYPYPDYPKIEKPRVDNPNNKWPLATGTKGVTNGIREATITGDPYPVKGWLVYATNLIYTMPNIDETLKAIQNLDLLVVIDVIPSEITSWADVVLPESIYLERYDDFNVPWFREPSILIRQPVIESPHDQKPNWWIAKKLADKLGLGHYYPWDNVEEYLKYRIEKADMSYEKIKKEGVLKGPKVSIYNDPTVGPEFYTPSGKVEFYSNDLADLGFDPMPVYTKPDEPPAGYFRLLFGRAPVHTFGRTQTNRVLNDMMEENEVWIHTSVAKNYGIENGQYIKLKNQDGVISNKVKAKVTERLRTDCVYMVHGFGHSARSMRGAYKKGASDSELITKYKVDPIMGGTGMNVNFVTFEWEV